MLKAWQANKLGRAMADAGLDTRAGQAVAAWSLAGPVPVWSEGTLKVSLDEHNWNAPGLLDAIEAALRTALDHPCP